MADDVIFLSGCTRLVHSYGPILSGWTIAHFMGIRACSHKAGRHGILSKGPRPRGFGVPLQHPHSDLVLRKSFVNAELQSPGGAPEIPKGRPRELASFWPKYLSSFSDWLLAGISPVGA